MNIILIISDTFRYDNLFDRAEMPVSTPNLDAFSKRAVSLSKFYTGSFPTIPQRTELISGRYGWPWYGWQDLQTSTKNALPKLLAHHGYVSQLICDCPHLFNSGFQHTFDAANAIRGQEGDLFMLKMNHEIKEAMPREKTRTGHHFLGHNLVDLHRWINRDWKGEEDCFPPRTAKLAIKWLEENYRFSPFFLWVDFFDPHEPWDPPEYMVGKYDPDYDSVPMLHPNYGKASDYTKAELRNLRAHYCAEAELVDRWIGRLLQKIDDLNLLNNSIVIFTSDHGISLGEHNRTGKTNINEKDNRHWPLYPEIAHIPFMISAPGLKDGIDIDTFAQPADIMPTLADLAGINLDPPERLHGVSFAPQLRGKSTKSIHDFVITGRNIRCENDELPSGSITPVLYTDKWAYVPIGPKGNAELYNIAKDAYAMKDVSGKHPDIVRELQEKMMKWLKDIDAPPEALEAINV